MKLFKEVICVPSPLSKSAFVKVLKKKCKFVTLIIFLGNELSP